MTADEQRVKHLDMIEAAIARMAQNSFVIKGWSITLVSALLGFGGDKGNPRYAWLAVVVAIVFGGLDAYYLQLERRFRLLYDAARVEPVPTFSMDISPHSVSYADALFRPAVLIPHGIVVLLALAVLWAVRGTS